MPKGRSSAIALAAADTATATETRFRGVRKRPWGRFAAEIREKKAWNSCCVGGLAKPQPISDRPVRQPRNRDVGQSLSLMKKPCSSTSEVMENNVSISPTLETNVHSGPSVVNEETELIEETSVSHPFVNEAAIAWNEMRKEWIGDGLKNSHNDSREPVISWCMTYEELLSTSQPFSRPIPLSEMVDFLVDVWHEEGLYD